jgi:signal transduction histidine kinase
MDPETSRGAVERVDLSAVLGEMAAELSCLLGPHIRLATGSLPAGGRALVAAERDKIVDLLRHLALDAHDAMPAGGTVTIRTGCLREVTECAAIVIYEAPGAAEDAPRPMRKGRSLSLGASYDMIERAGGHFHVSCRGRETVLTICFPLAA